MDIKEKVSLVNTQLDLFLEFFKANYKLFHNSNVFRKDIFYAIKRFLEIKNVKSGLTELEFITDSVVSELKNKGYFLEISPITWRLINETYNTSAPRIVIESNSSQG